MNDTSRLQKTIEHYERVRKYWKRKLNNILLGTVHTGVEVYKIHSEMSRLVE